MRDRASNAAAKADLRSGVAAAEAYFQDARTYAGLTIGQLKAIDGSLPSTMAVGAGPTDSSYCLQVAVDGFHWHVDRHQQGQPDYQTGDC